MAGINIKVENLARVRRQLEEYSAGIKSKCRKMQEYLAEIGINHARFYFAKAQYDGENDVKVAESPEWVDENTLRIRAYGTSILFIEFGTGVHYSAESHPLADEFGYVRGGYGEGMGAFDAWEYWGKPGSNGEAKGEKGEGEIKETLVRTHGNPANRSMYNAGKDMRRAILETARYIFA